MTETATNVVDIKSTVDTTPTPTIEQITKEFNECSAKAGWLQFRIACDSQEIQKMHTKMSELNDIASKMKTETKTGETNGSNS